MKKPSSAVPSPVRPVYRVLPPVLLWLWGMAAARLFRCCDRVDATFFRMVLVPDRPWLTIPLSLLPLLLLPLLRRRSRDPEQLTVVLAPLAGVLPLLYLPPNLWSVAILAGVTGWTGFRMVRAGLLPPLPVWCARHPRWCAAAVWLLIVLLAGQAYAASVTAFDHLYLAATDWATYAEAAYHTLAGRWFYADYPEPCWSAGHFMPGFFLLTAPWFGWFPSAHTAFVLNGLLLFGSGGLLYHLGRRSGIDPFTAGAAAGVWLLHPSVSNLNLCNFYGFNGEYLFIPFFFLFLWSREQGCRKTAWLLALLTLSFKETFAVFWAGWGMMQLAAWCAGGGRARLREGLAACIIGGVYYWICIRWIIPRGGGGEYIFFSQYAQLGDDIPSILLSPLQRPAAFWGTLIHPKNLFVLLMILLPFLPGALARWPILGAPVLVIGFHFLRVSRDVVNLSQHYQLTLLCCGAGALLWGIPRLCPGGRLDRWLCAGFRPMAGRGRLRYAAALSSLLMAVIGHWFLAQSFYGPNSLRAATALPDGRAAIADLKQIIPAGEKMAADESTAGHFLFRNPVIRLNSGDPDADWALEVQGDWKSPDAVAVHAALLANPAWHPVWFRRDGVRKYYLFSRRPEMALPVPVPEAVPPGAVPFFRQNGLTLWQAGNRIIGHGRLLPGNWHGYPEIRVAVAFSDGSVKEFPLLPGNGLIPLQELSAGTVWSGSMEIPAGIVPVDAAAAVRPIGAAPNIGLPPTGVVIDGLRFSTGDNRR